MLIDISSEQKKTASVIHGGRFRGCHHAFQTAHLLYQGDPQKSRKIEGSIIGFINLLSSGLRVTLVHSFDYIVHSNLRVRMLWVESVLTQHGVCGSGVPAGDRMGHRLMCP